MKAIIEKITACFMSIILLLSGAVHGSTAEKAEKLRVVSYLVINNLADAERINPSHFTDLTDVILFGGLASYNGDSEVILCEDFDKIIDHVKSLDTDGHLRWQLNLGGIAEGDQKMAWRKAFHGKELPKNIRATLEQYDLDGVFFDYEFPMEWDAKLDFSIFLINLRKELGGDFHIGAALQPWCARFLPSAIRAIDMVELMSYDNWDEDGFHATLELAKKDVKDMVKLGYKLSQIDLGVPFYARPTTGEALWYDYAGYYDKLDDKGLYYDANRDLTFSFNRPELVYEKTAWAIETGLGGMMIWHYNCDIPAENEQSLFHAITHAKTELAGGNS